MCLAAALALIPCARYATHSGSIAENADLHHHCPRHRGYHCSSVFIGWLSASGFGALPVVGAIAVVLGAYVYFRCAWEFAVRGLGTPAPIAPTKYLVVSALHRYVRNPMYLGVAMVILGQAALFRAPHLAEYAVAMLVIAHLFVILYEEPTLHGQFGESYDEYRRSVPRWIPRFRK